MPIPAMPSHLSRQIRKAVDALHRIDTAGITTTVFDFPCDMSLDEITKPGASSKPLHLDQHIWWQLLNACYAGAAWRTFNVGQQHMRRDMLRMYGNNKRLIQRRMALNRSGHHMLGVFFLIQVTLNVFCLFSLLKYSYTCYCTWSVRCPVACLPLAQSVCLAAHCPCSVPGLLARLPIHSLTHPLTPPTTTQPAHLPTHQLSCLPVRLTRCEQRRDRLVAWLEP